jgi:hypothetical protein
MNPLQLNHHEDVVCLLAIAISGTATHLPSKKHNTQSTSKVPTEPMRSTVVPTSLTQPGKCMSVFPPLFPYPHVPPFPASWLGASDTSEESPSAQSPLLWISHSLSASASLSQQDFKPIAKPPKPPGLSRQCKGQSISISTRTEPQNRLWESLPRCQKDGADPGPLVSSAGHGEWPRAKPQEGGFREESLDVVLPGGSFWDAHPFFPPPTLELCQVSSVPHTVTPFTLSLRNILISFVYGVRR